jgi:two-component system phosphate regulon sensor histidine kinase PhoR
MQQVIINLVGNAIKFSKPVSTVQIISQATADQVTVKVIDQGSGIPQEALPRLFEKFYQADSALKRAGQGSGLGLYISKRLVEAHGGEIGVTSQVGQGSIFYFYLPRSVVEPSASPIK